MCQTFEYRLYLYSLNCLLILYNIGLKQFYTKYNTFFYNTQGDKWYYEYFVEYIHTNYFLLIILM